MNRTDPTRPTNSASDSNSADALEAAFLCCRDELLGTLFYLIGNREDARDAIEEAFVKCWRHRNEAASVENLRTWIFRIALATGRDVRATAWRRRRRSHPEDEPILTADGAALEMEDSHREEMALVRRALLGLRPEEQEVFMLRQNGRMTYEEIAQSTEIPLGTVKTRMRLALVNLREAVQRKSSEE